MASDAARSRTGAERPVEPAPLNGYLHDGRNGCSPQALDSTSERVPFPAGGPLLESDFGKLSSSWITREIADAAMLRRVDAYEGREVVGQKGSRDCAGILFPYYWPGQPHACTYRLRRDHPDWKTGSDGRPKLDKKYLAPPGSSNRLYLPPGIDQEQLQDVATPIVISEGEKMGLALSRLARYETERGRFIPVAIPGVWSWRGVTGKANGPNGERISLKGPINDLDRLAWKGRRVLIVFDTNVHTVDSVRWARIGLARELATRGSEVEFVNLPQDCGVNGIDDLLGIWGPDRVLKLFEKPVPGTGLDVVLPPQFQSRPHGMFRVTQRGERLSETQLCNYRASIKANVRLDDGVETKREFEIESELLGRSFQFTIPASEFTRMDWPIAQMGSGAITFPNQREYARTAIQSFSMTAEERCIYTHTGWRNVDGRWLFLHAAGAIGAAGPVSDVQVRLPGLLGRYELRASSEPDALVSAIRASLRLAKLAPPSISFPLLAATYRAVIGGADFAIHVAGETGSFKSELAALHQQHFGAGMNRVHLPGAWSSTGNSIEALAFHAKDALLVIDDFAPHGNSADVARYHAAADRVFRAAGNQAGRGRLDSTANLREPKPPRAMILSTGEDIPRGQSVRARLLILELLNGSILTSDLSECQRDAHAGLYAEAMGSFVQWFAGSYKDLRARFERRVLELRDSALRHSAHARTPEIVANLQAGFEVLLEFAMERGATDATEREQLKNECWEAVREAAAEQGKHQSARILPHLPQVMISGMLPAAELAMKWSSPSRRRRISRRPIQSSPHYYIGQAMLSACLPRSPQRPGARVRTA
jgi:hypothetical protein